VRMSLPHGSMIAKCCHIPMACAIEIPHLGSEIHEQ
jgi:hypothetical protein